MLHKQLLNAGFSEKEALVYLALLELGEGNIAQITKKSNIKRATVYLEIESLKKKGLVSQVKRRGRNIFIAENPRRIEEQLLEKKEYIHKLMPQLLSITNTMGHKPIVRFFEGEDGLKEIYNDTLKYSKGEILGWFSDDRVEKFDKSFVLDYYMKKRIALKIPMRAIAIDSSFFRKMKAQDTKQLRQIKLIGSDSLFFASEINLYAKNKIAIIAHRENIGLIIESKKIFDTLKSIFEIMWLS